MITRPFNFEAHLRRPAAGLEAVPFVDACLIAIFFTVLSSRFVLAPGVAIDLPSVAGAPSDMISTSRVLTVGENEGRAMIIFEGRLHNELSTVEAAMVARTSGESDEVLLIRADRDVSMQLLARVCELARASGYRRVHLAVEAERAASSPFP